LVPARARVQTNNTEGVRKLSPFDTCTELEAVALKEGKGPLIVSVNVRGGGGAVHAPPLKFVESGGAGAEAAAGSGAAGSGAALPSSLTQDPAFQAFLREQEARQAEAVAVALAARDVEHAAALEQARTHEQQSGGAQQQEVQQEEGEKPWRSPLTLATVPLPTVASTACKSNGRPNGPLSVSFVAAASKNEPPPFERHGPGGGTRTASVGNTVGSNPERYRESVGQLPRGRSGTAAGGSAGGSAGITGLPPQRQRSSTMPTAPSSPLHGRSWPRSPPQ
jgi:hypothetical protein